LRYFIIIKLYQCPNFCFKYKEEPHALIFPYVIIAILSPKKSA